MGQLCIYLTPFASDYSGACSALFDLNCMTAINDGGCCTSHYVYYDEPRWTGEIRPVFSTAIRSIDSILGNDDKIINSICEAAQSMDVEMIAVVGTPVPALTGMDLEGIAAEIEYRTGHPCFGFNTTGFHYYDRGIFAAGKALVDRFAEPMEVVPGRVNLCGMTPLDLGSCGNDSLLVQQLQAQGYEVGCRFFMGLTTQQVAACASAERNLAVSAAGLRLAKYLKKRFGTPYTVGIPFAADGPGTDTRTAAPSAPDGQTARTAATAKTLIVADQVIGCSIRDALAARGADIENIAVATFFGFDEALARPGDRYFAEEAEYLQALKEQPYQVLIADPDLFRAPQAQRLTRIPLVHPAVSGQLGWNNMPRLDAALPDTLLHQLRTLGIRD